MSWVKSRSASGLIDHVKHKIMIQPSSKMRAARHAKTIAAYTTALGWFFGMRHSASVTPKADSLCVSFRLSEGFFGGLLAFALLQNMKSQNIHSMITALTLFSVTKAEWNIPKDSTAVFKCFLYIGDESVLFNLSPAAVTREVALVASSFISLLRCTQRKPVIVSCVRVAQKLLQRI